MQQSDWEVPEPSLILASCLGGEGGACRTWLPCWGGQGGWRVLQG